MSIKSLGWAGGCDLVMEGLLQINNLLKGLFLFFKERVCVGGESQHKASVLNIQLKEPGKLTLSNSLLYCGRNAQSL